MYQYHELNILITINQQSITTFDNNYNNNIVNIHINIKST